MGCNYFLVYNETEDSICHCCRHETTNQKKRHLGKSSGGWTFGLRVYPDEGITTWGDIQQECLRIIVKGGWIEDEYGDEITLDAFHKIVTERGRKETIDQTVQEAQKSSWWAVNRYTDAEDYLQRNHAIRGPNNLLRRKLSQYCIGHGEGTYDYCVGDFS